MLRRNLPNYLTLANLSTGCLAIYWAQQGQLYLAAGAIVLGAAFDLADGAVARALRVTSPLGLQLDSLADLVTFGLAPSFVWLGIYRLLDDKLNMDYLRDWAPLALLLIPAASAWRLAVFNLDTRQKAGFLGLPTPANALYMLSWLWVVHPGEGTFWAGAIAFHPLGLILMCSLQAWLLNSGMPLMAFKSGGHPAGRGIKLGFLTTSGVLMGFFGLAAGPTVLLLYLLLSRWEYVRTKNA